MKPLFTFLILSSLIGSAKAQTGAVAINTDGSTANSSALLDIKSTNQGILIPRMTASQRSLINSPATGLMVYQTDAPIGFYFYNGTAWASINGTTLPPQANNAGKVLTTDGNNLNWGAPIGSGAKIDLIATKSANTQVLPSANGTNTGDLIVFDNVASSPTLGAYNTSTNTYTVGTGQAGLYYIQVKALTLDNATANNTVGPWFKIEIKPNGGTSSFINERDIYGPYPLVANINFPSGLKGRGEISAMVALNEGDSFVIKGLSANSSATTELKKDGSCKLLVVKMN